MGIAGFALLSAFYFFFKFISTIFKVLRWRKCSAATGCVLGETEKGYAVAVGGNTKKYAIEVEYVYNNVKMSGVIIEKRTSKEASRYTVGETLDIRFIDGKPNVITEEEYAAMKKNLILYPICAIGSFLILVIANLVAKSL